MLPFSAAHRRITFPLLLLFFAHSLFAETTPAPSPSPAPNLAATIESFARDHDFSGTILVQQGDTRLYHDAFGLADRAFAVPADKKTRYRIASITKLFTSALILQLHQENKIDLGAPIRTYLPDYPGEGGDRVTVHQLLNHTSGLEQWDNVASYQEAFANGVDRYQRPIAAKARLGLCCAGKLTNPPGTKFNYNNADYFVLGAIVERIAGKPFEEVLAERILKPAGLNDTGMLHWDAIVERLAPTYFFRDDLKVLVNDMPVYYENWSAAAGMYSTPDDLLAFAEALYGGKLLRPETLDKLLKPGLDDYGYGLWSYRFKRDGKEFRVAKRPGSSMGANAVLYRLLDRETTIVLLANTNKADLDVFAQRIADVLVK
jgi:D-alanyl-D-alanine carboxypeptidase